MKQGITIRVVAALFYGAASAIIAAAADTSANDYFETQIRPVLAESCYECHNGSTGKTKGGLALDTRGGWEKGGDSGPAVTPGDPDKSLLIKAIRYTDENLQMPPKNKRLSPEKVAAFEQWVKMGAPDPRSGAPSTGAPTMAEGKKHWAFQPVHKPVPPAVQEAGKVQNAVDNFIFAKLQEKKLQPSRKADKRTLIRRAYYDLTGLPPSADEVEAFTADKSPKAFEKVVDRLLASPRYGERWGRYWLDVARYADTKGYVFEEERRYPYSYTYRDYVIRAFNEDLPYDRFVIEQLAADSLSLTEDKRPLAALGFLTLGRRFLNNESDIIDDRLDVVGRGFMGLTVSCARCHDHKFDPISTKDYYSLYGVFASSEEPADKPLLGTNSLPSQYPEYLAEREKRQKELDKFVQDKRQEALQKVRAQTGDYLLAVHDSKAEPKDKEALIRARKLSPRVAERWNERLQTVSTNDPVFGVWFLFASLPTNSFADTARALHQSLGTGSKQFNGRIISAFSNAPGSLKEVSAVYNRVFAEVDREWMEKTKATNAPSAFADTTAEELRQILYADNSPFKLGAGELRRLLDTPAQQRERALKRKVDELDATHPGAPPKAMALVDKKTPVEPVVFVRGNPGNRGPKVPRQFLEVLSPADRKPFEKGSGRLELAEAIADRNNPLTARVWVNRVWMHHFGAPLVRTPSDFGLRSDAPINPELLDYLASVFMEVGWSTKKLHRLIMLSATYQQSSEENLANAAVDSANEYLWRMNRRRLDFESMRDSLLQAAGRLDLSMGGLAADITTQPFTTRRTVYAFIERQNLPGIFRTFDFASPDTSASHRFATTVPQQALFLLNSPFVVEQAKSVLNRPALKSATDDAEKVDRIYRIVYQRAPTDTEKVLGKEFVAAQSTADAEEPAPASEWQYGYGEFDADKGKVVRFVALPHFTGSAWQGGAKLPDDKLGWVTLNPEGGHVGNDLKHAAIRRWTAPRDGTVVISGQLAHDASEGDGVRGRAVSSRIGKQGEWVVHNRKERTRVEAVEVKKGDHLDFVVDMRSEYSFDSFIWAPKVRFSGSGGSYGRAEWSAKDDFAGPRKAVEPLNPWQQYAQALLLANEFMFVD